MFSSNSNSSAQEMLFEKWIEFDSDFLRHFLRCQLSFGGSNGKEIGGGGFGKDFQLISNTTKDFGDSLQNAENSSGVKIQQQFKMC